MQQQPTLGIEGRVDDVDSNIDALTGMSAMDGINQLTTQLMEINMTVSKVEQRYKKPFESPISEHAYTMADDFESLPEPSTGLEPPEQQSRGKRIPYGIQRFHNSNMIGCSKLKYGTYKNAK